MGRGEDDAPVDLAWCAEALQWLHGLLSVDTVGVRFSNATDVMQPCSLLWNGRDISPRDPPPLPPSPERRGLPLVSASRRRGGCCPEGGPLPPLTGNGIVLTGVHLDVAAAMGGGPLILRGPWARKRPCRLMVGRGRGAWLVFHCWCWVATGCDRS